MASVGQGARARKLGKAALFLLIASFSEPAFAYRSGADLPEFSATPRVRWSSDFIDYVVNDRMPSGQSLIGTQTALREAFAAWMTVPCSLVEFRSAGSTSAEARPGDWQNTIQWVSTGWTGRGFPADAAAVTDVQYEERDGNVVIVEADLYLNAESLLWVDHPSASNERDLLSVATHEAGHMLGLLHPCEPAGGDGAPDCASDPAFAETTMYPMFVEGQSTLSDDDEAGACFLYPGSRCEEALGGCGEGRRCTPEGCRAECAGALCEPGQNCVNDRCETPCADCPPSPCASDDDCSTPLRCDAGACVPGTAAIGDDCASGRDCAGGFCSEGGACLPSCVTDAECAAGINCVPNGEGHTCGLAGNALGAPCDSANDCAAGFCVADLSASPVCSRACGTNAACPANWECTSLGGQSVCAPSQGEAGCACTSAGSGTGTPVFALAWLLGAAAFRRSRRSKTLRASTRER